MDKVINFANLAGWAYLLLSIGLQVFVDRQAFVASDITSSVYIIKGIQLFQVFDIILILLGKSKGSLIGSIFQILGRNIVTLIFINPDSDKLKFATVAILWSIAQVNRYLYYLFKDNRLTGFLRYNAFLVLYPFGTFGEMMIINDFIKINSETLTDPEVYFIRFVQAGIIIGFLALYNYMLKSRQKYFKSLE